MTATPVATSPPLMTPSAATPSGSKKIILKRSVPATPADGVPPSVPVPLPTPSTTTQKGRVTKPTAKKRATNDSDDERPLAAQRPTKRPKLLIKKPLISLKGRTASIVVKPSHKGEVPTHPRGEGYDSEDEERETDPVIEEACVFRMYPGEYHEYIQKMIAERKFGVPVKDGGADFQLKWLAGAERRAVVTVKGAHFAAVLVDLPTITESMKTWDRRNFMKSADICQMLWVFAPIAKEEDAKTIALPNMVSKDHRWPHGLTPPMHDCIHRRFRKRLSKKEIKDKEAELQRLLNEDKLAVESKWELVDDGRPRADEEQDEDDEDDEGDVEDEDEDADGELEDYFGMGPDSMAQPLEIDDAELEAEFFDDEMADGDVGETPATQPDATPATARTGTPAAQSGGSEKNSDGDEEDDDDDDDGDDDELDEDARAQAALVKGIRTDIADLKAQMEHLTNQRYGTQNVLLIRRIEANIKTVKSELHLKLASIGEVDEEEE